MKSITFDELDELVAGAQQFVGQPVSDVIFGSDVLLISFYVNNTNHWLVADISKRGPFFLVGEGLLSFIKKQQKPLSLFLTKRLRGSEFLSIRRQEELGRVLVLEFTDCELELHLMTSVKNIIARSDGKQLSANKVKDIEPVVAKLDSRPVRGAKELFCDWKSLYSSKKTSQAEALQKDFDKELRKKNSTHKKLIARLKDLKKKKWHHFAEELSEQREQLDVSKYEGFFDSTKSVDENISVAYTKAKAEAGKIKGTQERLDLLDEEIESFTLKSFRKKKPRASLLEGAKGRTKKINDKITIYVGKSAKDNLLLLRKAKPWHIWLHLKDIPSAHAVMSLDKTQAVTKDLLDEAALWLLKCSLSDKQYKNWQGVKCEVLQAQCRYVVPQKGGKLGQVYYKNESTFVVIL